MKRKSLINSLRDRTHKIHHRLHFHPIISPLWTSSFNQEHYIHILKAFYGFYKPTKVAHPFLKTLQASIRVNWIEQDMAYLSYQKEIPMCIQLPNLDTSSKCIGYWYVIEGSNMGSTVIYKRLKKSLGLSATKGARFFYANGNNTVHCWDAFKLFLTQQSFNPIEQEEIISGAVDTFTALERWLWYCYKESL